RDGVLEDQLFLIVCFKNHGVLVEAFDFSYQFYAADQKNRDGCLVSTNSVEVDVLNVLGRCFVFHRNSLKSDKRFNKLIDLVLNLIGISRSIKPCNIGLLTKPSHLTLGIVSGVTLDYTNRLLPGATGIQIGNNMPVTDRLERFRTRRNTSRQQFSHFFDQTSVQHLLNTLIDAPVQLFSRRIQPYEMQIKTG